MGPPVLEECLGRGIAFVPFCPLGWPRGQHNPVLTSPLVIRTAARLGITPAQVALPVAATAGPQRAAQPGTGSVAHLRENLAAERMALDDEALRNLDAVAPYLPAALLGFIIMAGAVATVFSAQYLANPSFGTLTDYWALILSAYGSAQATTSAAALLLMRSLNHGAADRSHANSAHCRQQPKFITCRS
jgi:hypothetical protein